MTPSVRSSAAPTWDIGQITDNGERVTHLHADDCYYAHLSIYAFAAARVKDKQVLDAGSGTGYGSAYLADHGARFVTGLDISSTAVAFSQASFQRPNLKYQVMDLEAISGFPERQLDVIFSSNSLEHLPHVLAFMRTAWQLLKPAGELIVAVPPITNADLRAANEANPYHLNIWTPQQWAEVLGQYFAEVSSYRHISKGPEQVLRFEGGEHFDVTENDFAVEALSLAQLAVQPTLTAIFVARQLRPAAEVPAARASVTFVDDSYTRSSARSEPEPPPVSWWKWPGRAWEIFRHKGAQKLVHRTGTILHAWTSAALGSKQHQ